MADLKSFADHRSALLHIDPRRLKVKPGLNARNLLDPDTQAHITWLAENISQVGMKQPLVIFSEGEDVFISDGHCRLAGVMKAIAEGADIKTVPCLPEPRGTNDVDRVLTQNVYNSGKPLTPLEQGFNIKRAHALGLSVTAIAAKIGKSPAYVSQALDFQAAPAEVHQLVASGAVSATLAAKTVREVGGADATTKLKKAVETARKAGKKRATEKHVEKKPTKVQAKVVVPEHEPIDVVGLLKRARHALKSAGCEDSALLDALSEALSVLG